MSLIKTNTYKCTEVACKMLETGICLEGLSLEKCSHRILVDSIVTNLIPENEYDNEITDSNDYYDCHTGDTLDIEGCRRVTSASLTRLVILAGNVKFGKTTLLASLFQLFQDKSSYCQYKFAGSLTLIGLEKRCHKSRISSQAIIPDTDRTILSNSDEFIHLRVKKQDSKKIDLLFTDVSGEKFKSLANSEEECKNFIIADRADHFVLFIDAESLCNKKERQSTRVSSFGILRSLIEAGMLNQNTYIQVVFSRWDLITDKPDLNEDLKFIEQIKSDIKNKYINKYKNISFHEVASRPVNNLEFGHGLEKLLPIWVENSRFVQGKSNSVEYKKYINENSREIFKF